MEGLHTWGLTPWAPTTPSGPGTERRQGAKGHSWHARSFLVLQPLVHSNSRPHGNSNCYF